MYAIWTSRSSGNKTLRKLNQRLRAAGGRRAVAQLRGFPLGYVHGFAKRVPMADAEIVRLLQEEDFAYMK